MILKGAFGWGEGEGKVWVFQGLPVFQSKRAQSLLPPLEEVKKAIQSLTHELIEEKKGLKKGKDFLEFPLAVLCDPQLWKSIQEFLKKGKTSSEAVKRAFFRWEKELEKLDESYLRLRIQDLVDLRQRLLRLLSGQADLSIPPEPFIAVGKELYVTELLRLQHFPVQGICLEEGNESAHGVMLAKALEIPVVGRISGLLKVCRPGDLAVIKGSSLYLNEKIKISSISRRIKPIAPIGHFFTRDKISIAVRANVQLPEELIKAKEAGAQGIGLFRTEFLLMEKPISVEEEAKIYRQAIDLFLPHSVIFRLADFGSDKPYEKISWPPEKNPALGWRGLRFLLDSPHLLKRQLEALFKGAGKSKLHLLLPMVRLVEEVNQFLTIFKPLQKKFRTPVKLGVMLETPSLAYALDKLPKEVDFVSLGTNDLLQYFFAVDRLHPKMKANPLHPAFLLFLKEIIDKAKRSKKSISLCGEIAGDREVLPVLLGLGLREFSVSIPKILHLHNWLTKISMLEAKKLTRQALSRSKKRD